MHSTVQAEKGAPIRCIRTIEQWNGGTGMLVHKWQIKEHAHLTKLSML